MGCFSFAPQRFLLDGIYFTAARRAFLHSKKPLAARGFWIM
jgi:hypothetical protein